MTNPYRAALKRLMNTIHDLRLEGGNAELKVALNTARALLAEPEQDSVIPVKQHIFPTPSQAAECGGPCYEGNYCPEACDCGLYRPPTLAEPEAEGPADEQLTLTYALAVAAAVDGTSKPWPADLCERAQLSGLRAVLARWGRPAARALLAEPGWACPGCEGTPATVNSPCAVCGSPAAPPEPEPGEVRELVEWLRGTRAARLTRAAELLQQLSAPAPVVVPVPVSERQPGPEDCDEQGRCWVGIEDSAGLNTWSLVKLSDVSAWVRHLRPVWLPAHVLPVPEATND